MFLGWLLEQDYRTDEIGQFAKIVYDDSNNGCMTLVKSAIDIDDHFSNYHPKTYALLHSLLEKAFAEYAISLAPK